jgi:hypothetical protein
MTASSSVAAKKKRKPLAVSSCQVRLLKSQTRAKSSL